MRILPDRVPLAERLLISALADGVLGDASIQSALCTSLGRGQFSALVASHWPESRVDCHFLDLYRSEQAERWLDSRSARVSVHCTADFPEEEYDLVALPGTARGDGELTREQLQTGFLRLRQGGRLLVATDNGRDTWLGEQMERFFRRVRRFPSRGGVVYVGIKAEPLRKVKDYSCEFAFRDGTRLIRVFSRPGVFSHRQLDVGTRALIESMSLKENQRVLDLGCGSGAVSLAAAFRATGTTVTALDANPRALACTQRGAELNGLDNIRTVLNADAETGETDVYDLALANPPYFSHFRIGEIFVQGAARALRPGGTLLLVTKQPQAYMTMVGECFREATVSPVRQYHVVRAVR